MRGTRTFSMQLTQSAGDLASQVSARVRAVLAARRLSARSVAEQLGWTQSYMARRVNDKAPFSVADLEALAEFLGLSVEFFVSEERAA